MKITGKKGKGWTITETPTPDVPEYGPYDTKDEAVDIAKGISRFVKSHPKYFTEILDKNRLFTE